MLLGFQGQGSSMPMKPTLTTKTLENKHQGRRILFISHDARPHGAQILLLHFLRWFKKNTSIPFDVLLKEGGQLIGEFEGVSPVMLWNEGVISIGKKGLVGESIRKLKQLVRRGHTVQESTRTGDSSPVELVAGQYGLIYSNTITNGAVLEGLAHLGCPVICHVHELEYCTNYLTAPGNTDRVRRHTSHYVAVSEAVKRNLASELSVPDKSIELVYEFIHTQPEVKPVRVVEARKHLGFTDESIVIGASGTTDWRKGPDLFVQLAGAVRRKHPNKLLHFLWIGGESSGPNFGALQYDIRHLGLEGLVHFIGHQKHPLEYYSLFDVFALTSREDPYPLVNLEVALLKKPIVCFEGSGGAREFVEDDCGFVVPYLDIETMADRIVELVDKPELRRSMGERAAEKVRERHDVEVAAPKLLALIESYLN
jgi:glycosyltransferase involved in cell wall biosynthesis